MHWSPDNRRIAFCSNHDGNFEIYTMNVDGSDPARLTNKDSQDWTPKWSPEGSKMVFVSERNGNPDIYIAHLSEDHDVLELRQLTTNGGSDRHPVWRPSPPRLSSEAVNASGGPTLRCPGTSVRTRQMHG